MTPHRALVFGGGRHPQADPCGGRGGCRGPLVGTGHFAADGCGYEQLVCWFGRWSDVCRVCVEGTGSYGAGLARHLAAAGIEAVDVNRPNRQTRRRRSKTDVVDAETAARSTLNGDAAGVPEFADGFVEAIRTLSVARRSAVKVRTVAANGLKAVALTASERFRDRLRGLSTAEMVQICTRWRPAGRAAKQVMRALATRYRSLSAEIDCLDADLLALCDRANPALLKAVGVDAALLVAARYNARRHTSLDCQTPDEFEARYRHAAGTTSASRGLLIHPGSCAGSGGPCDVPIDVKCGL